MTIVFSDTSTNTGIVQQARKMMRVDSSQWPTANIVASVNNWHDFITGYAIGEDKRFQWDDTNHTALPEGTIPSTTSSDYSFLTDQQGNAIITLIGVSRLDSASGKYIPLTEVDRNDPSVDVSSFGTTSGTPTMYDKIADNIIRLDYKVGSVISAYFKFFFQRTGSYFVAADTTKSPGVSPLLHRGYVIAAAYDGALTLGLKNLRALLVEREKEEAKVVQYFASRNRDTVTRMVPRVESSK